MIRPKGIFNLIRIDIGKEKATIEIMEYSNYTTVKDWWLEAERHYFLFGNWEVWEAILDDSLKLQWHTRYFVCYRENQIKTHPLSPLGKGPAGSGYAYLNSGDEDRRKICFACAADVDKRVMDETGQITLHLDGLIALRLDSQRAIKKRTTSGVKIAVSNWCGSLSYPVELVRIGNGGISKVRRDVYFTDHVGRVWHGVQYGNKSELVYCKRMKEGTEIGKDKRTNRSDGAKESRGKNRRGEEGARNK